MKKIMITSASLREERGMSDVAEQAKKEFEVILRFFGKRVYDLEMKLTFSQGSLQVATLWMISQNSVCIPIWFLLKNPKSVAHRKRLGHPTKLLTHLSANVDLKPEAIEKNLYRFMFNCYDNDGNGSIDASELKVFLPPLHPPWIPHEFTLRSIRVS